MLRASLRIVFSVALATLAFVASSTWAQDQAGSKESAKPAVASDKSPAKDPGAQAAENQDVAGTVKPETESKGKTHFHLGVINVGAGYTHFSNGFVVRPFWPYGYPYGFGYSPFFYDSFYYPYYPSFYGPYLSGYVPYASGFTYEMGKGQVKLEAEPKTAAVRLDGAYAGTADKLKSMWLEPGAYDLTVSSPNGGDFHERIYVLSGKTVKIKATLVPQNAQPKSPDKR